MTIADVKALAHLAATPEPAYRSGVRRIPRGGKIGVHGIDHANADTRVHVVYQFTDNLGCGMQEDLSVLLTGTSLSQGSGL